MVANLSRAILAQTSVRAPQSVWQGKSRLADVNGDGSADVVMSPLFMLGLDATYLCWAWV